MVEISFPGLGIESFKVNPVAFEVFGLEVRWYGICIMLGMVAAFAYAIYRCKRENFKSDDVLDMGLYMVIIGVIGARLYYVIMEFKSYLRDNFWDTIGAMINIRQGGLAIYGGIIAGGLTLYVYCRIKKKNWLSALDMVAPGVMIAQAMGRWGNFFNGEAHGGIVSANSPLYFLRMGLYPNDLHTPEMAYVHPTFLYESLWNILGFVLINAFLYRRKKFNGQIFFTYIAWYGFGRMFIEGLRTDSLTIGPLRISQVVGALCFVIGTGLIIYMLCRTKKQEGSPAYEAVFTNQAHETEKQDANKSENTAVSDDTKTENETQTLKENENDGEVD